MYQHNIYTHTQQYKLKIKPQSNAQLKDKFYYKNINSAQFHSNLLYSFNILKSKKGVGILPALIASVVISGGAITLASVGLFSVNSAKNIELLATMETLNVNIEQTASSPSLLLKSKDHSDNSEFKTCLESNACAPLISPMDITLYNLAGDVISNGSGVFYNSKGKICASHNENHCPFKVTSQVKGYCLVSTCSDDNIKGFSISYKIDITDGFKNQQLFSKQNNVFMSRLEVLNASVIQSCGPNELLIGINNDNTSICVANNEVIGSVSHRTDIVHNSDGDGDGDGGSGSGGSSGSGSGGSGGSGSGGSSGSGSGGSGGSGDSGSCP